MRRLAERLNRSKLLSRLIAFFSTSLARYRGVPLLLAVFLIVISFFVHIIAAISGSAGWYVLAFTILHLAIFLGFLGILLAEPLGRG